MNATKTHVLRAALQVFDTTGLSTSTAAIAAAARVSNGTLFRCFPTKQALQHELYQRIDRDLSVAASEASFTSVPLEERVRRQWSQAASYALVNPAAFRYWVHYRIGPLPVQQATAPHWVVPVMEWLAEVEATGAVRRLPRALTVAQLVGLWQTTVRFLLDHPVSPEEAATWLDQTFTGWWNTYHR